MKNIKLYYKLSQCVHRGKDTVSIEGIEYKFKDETTFKRKQKIAKLVYAIALLVSWVYFYLLIDAFFESELLLVSELTNYFIQGIFVFVIIQVITLILFIGYLRLAYPLPLDNFLKRVSK